MKRAQKIVLASGLVAVGCLGLNQVARVRAQRAEQAERQRTMLASEPASSPSAVEQPPPPEPPVRVETLPMGADLPAFIVRARRDASPGVQMLFVPGMCVHPGGYIQAFQYAASARGDLVALQGDVSCGGDGFARRWSADLDQMNARIEAAFKAAGLGEPHGVTVIGYSQGAERAERLVARWPDRYARAVLIASPMAPSPANLRRARGVVLMAGTRDTQTAMRAAVLPLRRARVPSTFLDLPEAHHGQMGTTPEATMAKALDFLDNVPPEAVSPPAPPGAPR